MYQNDRSTNDEQYLRERIERYRQEREWFSIKVYLLAFIFIFLTIADYLCVILICRYKQYITHHVYIPLTFLGLGMLIIFTFIFLEDLRFIVPINWLLVLLSVGCIIIGLSRAIVIITIQVFGYATTVSLILFGFFICIGISIDIDLTFNVLIIFVLAIILFLASSFVVFLHMTVDFPYALYVYGISVIIIVLLFVMYHAQTISGGHYAEMRLRDFLLGALIVYHDYVMLLVAGLYVTQAVWEDAPSTLFNYSREVTCNESPSNGAASNANDGNETALRNSTETSANGFLFSKILSLLF